MKNGITLYIKESDLLVTFKKMTNHEWYEFGEHYAPISQDWDFVMYLQYHHYPERNFDLARLYMALYTLFGNHNIYDDSKCSFSYRLKLEVKRGVQSYTYGLALMDIKGNMPYFTYFRKPLEGERPDVYQQPIEEEFARKDMRRCTLSLLVFLEKFYTAYKPFFNQPFFRINPYAYLIYGFKEGAFFADYYPYESEQDCEDFQKKMEEYKQDELRNMPMSIGLIDG